MPMADKVKIVRDCNGIDLVVIPEILFRGKRTVGRIEKD